jgi:hypothetical protein
VPRRILERVLIAYAQCHRVESVRVFAAATSTYRQTLRVRWNDEGILLLTPEAAPGAMRKSPAIDR